MKKFMNHQLRHNITRQMIIDEALSWEGTPYHHLQRCKGAGVDCVGFIVGIGLNLGMITEEDTKQIPYYTRQWHLHRNDEVLLAVVDIFGLVEVPFNEMKPADLLVFKFGRVCSHAGILLPDNKMIHSTFEGPAKVMIHGFDGPIRKRLQHVYTHPGVFE